MKERKANGANYPEKGKGGPGCRMRGDNLGSTRKNEAPKRAGMRLLLAGAIALLSSGYPAALRAAGNIPSDTVVSPKKPSIGAVHHPRRRRVVAKPAAPKTIPESKTPAKESVSSSQRNSSAAIDTRLDSYQRNVEVQPAGGGWKHAERKMPLIVDDKIRTGSSSVARIKLADGTKVLLLQNSQAEMSTLTSLEKTIKLLKGHLHAIVAKIKGGNNFKITTPVGVASVRGTDFEVNVNDEGTEMEVKVFEGSVAVAKLGDLANEVVLAPGDRVKFGIEGALEPDAIKAGSVPLPRNEIRTEVQLASAKDAILSAAAEESRNADYQVGKSLIDVFGKRVRTEEYITRPAADTFKLVVLNERATRFDYFTYQGTFNKALPEDLSVALRQTGGQLTTAPDYHLTSYETLMSNTVDKITEVATGGHLVEINFDGTTYTLSDPLDPTNSRTISAATLLADGSYKIYDPVHDNFNLVTAAQKDDALKISVLDGANYRNLGAGDIYYRTRFNDYTSAINTVVKTAYAKNSGVANTLAIDFDASFSNAPIQTVFEQPSGATNLHNRLSLYYGDGSKTTYDTYIFDDEGNVAPTSTFDGISTSAEYKNQLDRFNYEQCVSSDEMNGRKIDLVVDPRIGTISGLIP